MPTAPDHSITAHSLPPTEQRSSRSQHTCRNSSTRPEMTVPASRSCSCCALSHRGRSHQHGQASGETSRPGSLSYATAPHTYSLTPHMPPSHGAGFPQRPRRNWQLRKRNEGLGKLSALIFSQNPARSTIQQPAEISHRTQGGVGKAEWPARLETQVGWDGEAARGRPEPLETVQNTELGETWHAPGNVLDGVRSLSSGRVTGRDMPAARGGRRSPAPIKSLRELNQALPARGRDQPIRWSLAGSRVTGSSAGRSPSSP